MTRSPTVSILTKRVPSVKIHRSEVEIEELRSFWTREARHPNSDLDHFLLVCRIFPEVASPFVISVWDEGACKGLLAGRLEHTKFQPRLAYLNLPRVKSRTLAFVYHGAVGNLCPPEAERIVEHLTTQVLDRFADVVVFRLLPENSPLAAALLTNSRRTLGIIKPRWSQHWELTLRQEPGFLVNAMRSKHRSWIGRKKRELQAAFPGRIAWNWHPQINDVGPLLRQMELVARNAYQRALDAGFKDDHTHRERLSLFARRGELRVLILEIDGQPKGFWLGTVYRGTFHSEATGYAPELRTHEAGTQIFLRLVDELVKEGVCRFDFGLGDADYKRRFGDASWREATARLFGNTARARALRAYLGTCETLDRALRGLVARLGVTNRLKQFWRRRLAVRCRLRQAPCARGPSQLR